MKFYERRPSFSAVQFDGTTESIEQMDECANVHGYVIEVSQIGAAVTVDIGYREKRTKITVQRGDWLVRGPGGDLSTMTSGQLHERFEKADQ